jgi:hypothetical protein
VAFLGRENMSAQALQAQFKAKLDAAVVEAREASQRRQAGLTLNRQTSQSALAQAQAELQDYANRPLEYVRIGLGVATLVLVGIAGLTLAIGAWRLIRRYQATPFFAGAIASLGLCLLAAVMMNSIAPQVESPGVASPERSITLMPPRTAELNKPTELPPTGPLAMAAPAAKAPPESKGPLSLMSKAAARDEIRLEQLAEATRWHLERGAGAPGPAAASEDPRIAPQDGAKKDQARLRERFNQALAAQTVTAPKNPTKAAMAKATPAAPSMPPPSPLAPKPSIGQKAMMTEKRVSSPDAVSRRAYINVGAVDYETLVWWPDLHVMSGTAQVHFDVPPNASVYRVILLGNTAEGRLGFYEGRLEVLPDLGR